VIIRCGYHRRDIILTDEEKREDAHKDAVQKAFEEGLEQGYWVGRMISEALGRDDNNTKPNNSPQELSPFMQQIIDITKEKGVEFE
jgi:hypothetical protein